jgi:hypothetical protein
MAKAWDEFLPLVQPHLPTCPIPTLKTYLASTAADFCSRTQIWREDLDPSITAPRVADYDLDASSVVEAVLWVVVNDRPLSATDARLVPHERLSELSEPTHYWVYNDTTLRLFPTPDRRYSLRVAVALKPSRAATGVEDWIYETWADSIVDGTIAQIARIPGKDWSDPMRAEAHRALYERAITTARNRDNRNMNIRVQQRPAA